jgi:DNA-binding NarL/FixJ family response regulator
MIDPTRVLVADDEPLIRLLLRHAIQRREGLELVGEAADGAEALALADSLEPDVFVLDLSMPEPDGIEVTRRLRAAGRPCLIVIFSSSGGAEATVLAAGADQFVNKADGVDRAIDAVVALSARREPRG